MRASRQKLTRAWPAYFEQDVLARLRRHIERSLDECRMSLEESAALQKRYEDGLQSYTYLSREPDTTEASTPPPALTAQAPQPSVS